MFKSFTEGLVNPEAASLQNKTETVNRMATELPDPGQKLEPAVSTLGGNNRNDVSLNRHNGKELLLNQTEGAGKFIIGEPVESAQASADAVRMPSPGNLGPGKTTMEYRIPADEGDIQESVRTTAPFANGDRFSEREPGSDKKNLLYQEVPNGRFADGYESAESTAVNGPGEIRIEHEPAPDKTTLENRGIESNEPPLHSTLEHLFDQPHANETTGSAADVRIPLINEPSVLDSEDAPRAELAKTTLEHRFSDAPDDGGRTLIGSKLPEGRLNPAIFNTDAPFSPAPEDAFRTTGENRLTDAEGTAEAAAPSRINLTNQMASDHPGRFTVYGPEDIDA